MLLQKLELYGVKGNNHNWLKNYLLNGKQYLEIDPTTKTSLEDVKCGIPQVSILTPHLFL